MVTHMMEHPPDGWGANGAEYFVRKQSITNKKSTFLEFSQKVLVKFLILIYRGKSYDT